MENYELSTKLDKIAIGTDAEGFLMTDEGVAVSSCGLLGGEKKAPIITEFGGYLEDCVAWEINTIPVTLAEGDKALVRNIKETIREVDTKAKSLGLQVDITPAKLFAKDQLQDPQAMVSGCSASFDAWQLRKNKPVDLSRTKNRFASGDLHLSWPEHADHKYFKVNVIRLMDVVLGSYQTLNSKKSKRDEFEYARPGTHRPTTYGVEYKSLSNFWISDEKHIKYIFSMLPKILEVAYNPSLEDKLMLEEEHNNIRYSMESRDTAYSKHLMRLFKDMHEIYLTSI